MNTYAPTLEISRKALIKNYHLLSAKAKCRLWCVVKANAYGHGMEQTASILWQAGADSFAVATLKEAVALRQALPSARILILGITSPREVSALCDYRLLQTVHTLSYAKSLSALAPSALSIHSKLDVGMRRLGFDGKLPEQAIKEIEAVRALPNLQIDGIFGHFSCADDPKDPKTPMQIELFKDIVAVLRQKGINAHTHLCNSAGVLRFGSLGLDGARCGMALYGISPSPSVSCSALSPAMRLFCPIVQIKTIGKGEAVGYGGVFTAKEPTRIATLPIGYADGLLRACSGARVTLYGKKVPLVGRICMDMAMADIGALPADVGDSVRFFGKTEGELFALAKQANTSHYELLSLLSPTIRRIYTQ